MTVSSSASKIYKISQKEIISPQRLYTSDQEFKVVNVKTNVCEIKDTLDKIMNRHFRKRDMQIKKNQLEIIQNKIEKI